MSTSGEIAKKVIENRQEQPTCQWYKDQFNCWVFKAPNDHAYAFLTPKMYHTEADYQVQINGVPNAIVTVNEDGRVENLGDAKTMAENWFIDNGYMTHEDLNS